MTTKSKAAVSYPMRPSALAVEIAGADNAERFAKQLRAFLRANFTRPVEAKNSTWLIDEEAANAARAHFASRATSAPASE